MFRFPPHFRTFSNMKVFFLMEFLCIAYNLTFGNFTIIVVFFGKKTGMGFILEVFQREYGCLGMGNGLGRGL